MFGKMKPALHKLFGRIVLLPVLAAACSIAYAEMDAAGSRPQDQASISRQELLDRAQYWESRGRGDLAESIRNQLGRSAATGSDAGSDRGGMRSSGQVQDDRANYWESRGRSDLAEQIRQNQPAAGVPPSKEDKRRLAPLRVAATGPETSRSALEDYLLKNPDSQKTRLDLANIYRSSGEFGKARLQVDSVLLAHPESSDALYASAQLYASQRLWMETLQTLEKISPVSRNPEMASLQKVAWAHVQLDRADALVRLGRNAEAEVLLREVSMQLAIRDSQKQLVEPPPLWQPSAINEHKKRKKH